MEMQVTQCSVRVKPFLLKKTQILSSALEKARISKSGFKKAKLATLSHKLFHDGISLRRRKTYRCSHAFANDNSWFALW